MFQYPDDLFFAKTSVTGEATSSDIALESDGRIIQVGSTTAGNIDFALVRYNSNGTRDISFSSDGIITTDFYGNTMDEANAVAIDSSGKIVVAGTTGENFALARYLGAFNPPMPINGASSQTF